ncbi:MAG TPA: PH domain-containing protein [Flavobacterium sp.]|nr:PH domain-containing protein [Flavobacterium sp.]
MEFKASYGLMTKIVTAAIALLFTGLIVFGAGSSESSRTAYGAIFLIMVFGICLILSPRGYSVTKDELLIHRLIGNVHIKKADIKSVATLEKDDVRYAIRTFGVGGLFGYYGKFYNSRFGHMTWYMTRSDRPVLITTVKGKKIVLSPDEVGSFTAAFQPV